MSKWWNGIHTSLRNQLARGEGSTPFFDTLSAYGGMVDTGDLKSPAERRTGSSPVKRTLARLAKLVKAMVLETMMCRFESCIGHYGKNKHDRTAKAKRTN